MNLIDDVKDSIGDGKYLELCNAMKKLYTSNESTTPTPTPTRTTTDRPAPTAIQVSTIISTQTLHKARLAFKRNRKVKIIYTDDDNEPRVFFNNIELEWSSTESGEHIYTYDIDDNVAYYLILSSEPFTTDDIDFCLMEVTYLNTTILSFKKEELSITKEIR
jgi:hypothetical protein